MTLALAVLAQLLHLVLLMVAAPALLVLDRAVVAVLSGGPLPRPLQPWRDVVRLARKQGMVAETSSWLFRAAPAIGCGATVVAAALVPSFALGMVLAPWADLLAILGLLALGRLVLLLAALDPGTGQGGAAVARHMHLAVPAEVALMLAAMALALLSGSGNLAQIAAAQLDAVPAPHVSAALACLAVLAVALTESGTDAAALRQEYSGFDLAVLDGTDALRRLVWLNLIALVLLPVGLAAPDAGLAAWAVGVPGWIGRLLVLGVAVSGVRAILGTIPAHWAARLLGLAGVLGALAVILALSRTGAA